MNVPSTKELFIEQKKKVTKCFNEKHKNVIPIIKLSEYKREKNKEYNEQTLDYTIYGLEVRKRNREITPVIQSIQKDNKALIDNNLINKVIIPNIKFDMIHFGIEFKVSLCLETGTSFWIFSRLPRDNHFDDYSSIIHLEISVTNQLFISYGNIILLNNRQIYKTFSKEQIVLNDILQSKDNIISLLLNKEEKHKLYSFNITLIDTCNEKILILVQNGSHTFDFEANWYLPISEYRFVGYGASGSYCHINSIQIKPYEINNSKVVNI